MRYDRKVRYFSYVEKGEHLRNGGFAKLELREDICYISIQIVGCSTAQSENCQILAVSENREEKLGDILLAKGKGTVQLRRSSSNLCNGLRYDELRAIRIPVAAGRELYCGITGNVQEPDAKTDLRPGVELEQEPSVKTEPEPEAGRKQESGKKTEPESGLELEQEPLVKTDLDPGVEIEKESSVKTKPEPRTGKEQEPSVKTKPEPRTGKEQEPSVKTKPEPRMEREQEPSVKTDLDSGVEIEQEPSVKTEPEPRTGKEQEPNVKTKPEPRMEREQEPSVKTDPEPGTKTEWQKRLEKRVPLMDDKWKQLSEIYPHIVPFQDDREYLSIGPGDFVIFTQKFYKLVNNSFLLHGFYNYRHLILARMEKKSEVAYYVGVPGNFYDREKQVAVMFGFESFECQEEPAAKGDYGYYMIRVEI